MSDNRIDRTGNRSNSYQWILLECPCSPEMLAEISDGDGVMSQLNPWKYNEELLDLKDQLKVEMWRLIDTQLTPRQKEVIHLWVEGLTQTEIAKKLGVNQSSITKSINGNTDYSGGKKIYGGARKKLQKLAAKDEKIQLILKRIGELSGDD